MRRVGEFMRAMLQLWTAVWIHPLYGGMHGRLKRENVMPAGGKIAVAVREKPSSLILVILN